IHSVANAHEGVWAGAALPHRAPNPNPKLVAECREGLGEWEAAAADYLKAGSPQDALRCYRSIPDFEKSLALVDSIGQHPARESLKGLRKFGALAAERPADFNKVMLPAEKKLLEQLLETGLGVTRKKAAPRKTTAVKKPAAPRKTVRQPKKEFF